MKGNRRRKFWSFGKLRLRNFSTLLSLLPLLIGGFLAAVTAPKAEARHSVRYSEECCVVAQVGSNTVELAQFPDGYYGQLYRVYVPTYSDELFSVVQREVTSSAYPTIYRRRRVIIVTQSDLRRARGFVRELQRRGITAELEAIRSNIPLPDDGSSILPEDTRYTVFVVIGRRQDRFTLLDRVQAVEPNARVGRVGRRTVILVGQFNNRSEAQTLVNELQVNGLSGRIYVNPNRRIEPEISSNQNRFAGVEVESDISSNVDRSTPVQTQETRITAVPQTSYQLVIPLEQDELAAIEAQVRQMAIDLGQTNEILIEANPDRSELIIGPFNNLQTAQQWEGYLQDYGVMNALIR